MMAYYETNRQVIHLAKAKRCSDQADHLFSAHSFTQQPSTSFGLSGGVCNLTINEKGESQYADTATRLARDIG
jgi:hypothetical protein